MKVKIENVKSETKKGVADAVTKAMTGWEAHVKGKNIFVKINAMCDQIIPGMNTNPWVVEAVIRNLKKAGKNIIIGDADVATTKQYWRAAKKWGYTQIAKKYGARIINLSEEPEIKQKINGKVFKELGIPKALIEADNIITLPIIKTHGITKITGALKNQWGCVPRIRQQYHPVVNQAISDINKYLKVSYAVADATICQEGIGPRNGNPVITNRIIASPDLVALDTVAATMIGYNPTEVKMLKIAEQDGVGSMKYTLTGKIPKLKFEKARQHFIFKIEMKLRHTPILKTIIFKTPLFKLFGAGTTFYNKVIWYYSKGIKHIDAIKGTGYYELFKELSNSAR